MNGTEQLVMDIIAGGKSRSTQGDLSQALREQGFFDTPTGLSKRDKFLSGGNPVDVKEDFLKQNPN